MKSEVQELENSSVRQVLECGALVPLCWAFPRWLLRFAVAAILMITCFRSAAELTNSAALPLSGSLPSAGPSLLRVLGALAIVLGVFLGGAWLFRNGRHLRFRQGHTPRLNILESRGLGGKHALYVVGYDQQRMLVAASPAGITLLSQLPPATETASPSTAPAPASTQPPLSFAESLARILNGSARNAAGGRP